MDAFLPVLILLLFLLVGISFAALLWDRPPQVYVDGSSTPPLPYSTLKSSVVNEESQPHPRTSRIHFDSTAEDLCEDSDYSPTEYPVFEIFENSFLARPLHSPQKRGFTSPGDVWSRNVSPTRPTPQTLTRLPEEEEVEVTKLTPTKEEKNTISQRTEEVSSNLHRGGSLRRSSSTPRKSFAFVNRKGAQTMPTRGSSEPHLVHLRWLDTPLEQRAPSRTP
eukprot:gb/GEZN01013416.1/.p1 GENE.gb/GEZN01013416.1/~~gb/GEZN01013416.1/.p1  ORF type:complete len:249 (+),score=10.87 gb/GEZN01013416.1/:85-747(+)